MASAQFSLKERDKKDGWKIVCPFFGDMCSQCSSVGADLCLLSDGHFTGGFLILV